MPFRCKNACSRKEGIGRTWEQKHRLKPRYEVPDDKMFPFRSHGRCRTCQAWQRNTIHKCICCGSKLSLKPRENSKKRKYAPRLVSFVQEKSLIIGFSPHILTTYFMKCLLCGIVLVVYRCCSSIDDGVGYIQYVSLGNSCHKHVTNHVITRGTQAKCQKQMAKTKMITQTM